MSAEDLRRSPAVWHGTSEETRRLRAAIQHQCTCVTRMFGQVIELCPAHAMLRDQRVLDHLLYAYRLKARFERAEWSDDGAAGDVTSTWNPVGPDHDGPPDRLRLW